MLCKPSNRAFLACEFIFYFLTDVYHNIKKTWVTSARPTFKGSGIARLSRTSNAEAHVLYVHNKPFGL